jgi:hypothetical protein
MQSGDFHYRPLIGIKDFWLRCPGYLREPCKSPCFIRPEFYRRVLGKSVTSNLGSELAWDISPANAPHRPPAVVESASTVINLINKMAHYTVLGVIGS